MSGLLLFVASCWLGVAVMRSLSVTFTMMVFVHTFMQALGVFPAVLGAGRAEGDKGKGSEDGEGSFFH